MQPEATKNTPCAAAFKSFLPNTEGGKAGDKQIILQPGEHYMFFWSGVDTGRDLGQSDCPVDMLGTLAETLNFIPGAYAFSVDGRVHTAQNPNEYHTFAESVSVKLGIEQLTILLWAGIGAVLGYLVIALTNDGDVDKLKNAPAGKERLSAIAILVKNVVSAFLTGAVLSVVANRLSDTQFPIKVSVNDVWGALTVGFVFFFIGQKAIEKLRSLA
jgi:hypothetical protein